MPDFVRILGDVIKKRRVELGLTQSEIAETIDVDPRTILNIENYKGNPKWEILYPLIRTLKIDPSLLFYPELNQTQDDRAQFNLLLSQCTADEIQFLYPICQTLLHTLRSNSYRKIEDK